MATRKLLHKIREFLFGPIYSIGEVVIYDNHYYVIHATCSLDDFGQMKIVSVHNNDYTIWIDPWDPGLGEMNSVFDYDPDFYQIIEYGSKNNYGLEKTIALCYYHDYKFTPECIKEELRKYENITSGV